MALLVINGRTRRIHKIKDFSDEVFIGFVKEEFPWIFNAGKINIIKEKILRDKDQITYFVEFKYGEFKNLLDSRKIVFTDKACAYIKEGNPELCYSDKWLKYYKNILNTQIQSI